jgi:branched-subunit amino acid ABC-type transport system permease component
MGQQDRTMADTNGISIAETDAGNARMMIASAGFGGVAAATIRALPPQSYELQFF